YLTHDFRENQSSEVRSRGQIPEWVSSFVDKQPRPCTVIDVQLPHESIVVLPRDRQNPAPVIGLFTRVYRLDTVRLGEELAPSTVRARDFHPENGRPQFFGEVSEDAAFRRAWCAYCPPRKTHPGKRTGTLRLDEYQRIRWKLTGEVQVRVK